MRMKKIIILIFIAWLPNLTSCQDKAKMEFSITVVDDEGNPVPNCEAAAIFYEKNSGGAHKSFKRISNITDATGVANFSLLSSFSYLSYGAKAPEGYYDAFGQEFYYQEAVNGVWEPDKKNCKVILKRIKNPIAMYANKGPEYLPKENQDIGYDLLVSDWVKPYGKGEISDIIFNTVIDRGKGGDFSAFLNISFPGEKNGMVSFEAPVKLSQTSKFRSEYVAPLDGYTKKLTHTRVRQSGKAEKNTRKETVNYYIRVRTELDDNGNIVSAHYGKIYGDFMKFTHYLNSTPNDRNVEFDLKKNLIDTGYRGHKVQAP